MKIILKTMVIGLVLFCLSSQTVSAAPFDFSGTALGYSGTNIIYVNVTESKIPGLIGETEVLLPQPVAEYILNYLMNRKLSFDYLGHDITGKLISDAYFNGVRLQDLNNYCEYGWYPYCYEYYYPGYGYYYPGYGYSSGYSYSMSYG
jgi:hypothetical protein